MNILKIKKFQLSIVSIIVFATLFTSCEKDKFEQQTLNENLKKGKNYNIDLYEKKKTVELAKNNAHRYLDFKNEEDLKLIYNVAMQVDSIFHIFYQPENFSEKGGEWFTEKINTEDWLEVKKEIIEIYFNRGYQGDCFGPITPPISSFKFNFQPIEDMPILTFHTSSIDFLKEIANLKGKIKFIESNTSGLLTKKAGKVGEFGCQENFCNVLTYPDALTEVLYTDIQDEVYSWHNGSNLMGYDPNTGTDTWEYSTGEDIGIAIVGTGSNLDDTFINAPLNGPAAGNYNEKNFLGRHYNILICKNGHYYNSSAYHINPDDVHDRCGSGTIAASLIGTPRNSINILFGTAYGSNLNVYRVTDDGTINDSDEQEAIENALMEIAGNPDIHVVLIAAKFISFSSNIQQALAVVRASGKLIINGIGDSGNDSIDFPADQPSTIAVTGIHQPNSWDSFNPPSIGLPTASNDFPDASPCDGCQYSVGVDFSTIVENNLSPAPIAATNCTSNINVQGAYLRGTLGAAATFTGIVALVWSRLGIDKSADHVLTVLEAYASNGANPHPHFGNGYVNVDKLLSEN